MRAMAQEAGQTFDAVAAWLDGVAAYPTVVRRSFRGSWRRSGSPLRRSIMFASSEVTGHSLRHESHSHEK